MWNLPLLEVSVYTLEAPYSHELVCTSIGLDNVVTCNLNSTVLPATDLGVRP